MVNGMAHFGRLMWGLLLVAQAGDMCRAEWLTDEQAQSPPRARVACLPNPTLGVRYYDLDDLGPHVYGTLMAPGEHNGIVYTCRGGHIDVTHVRKAADWAAYLAYHCRRTLLDNRTQMSFKMREPSRYHLRFQYPPGWRRRPDAERERIAREISVQLGQYLGYVGSIWHEVLTWHGFRGSGIYPEFQSAFSWEDNYSNAVGAHIGGLALRDPNRPYAEAMTYYIRRELEELEVQSKEAAEQAARHVGGSWYTGGFFTCDMVKRHLDIGIDDGIVTPWLIPGIGGCGAAAPKLYPAPTLDFLKPYGFYVIVEIEIREWERHEILQAVYPNAEDPEPFIEPAKHFPAIMQTVRAAVIERYGLHADEAGVLPVPPTPSQTTVTECDSPTADPGSDGRSPEAQDRATSTAQAGLGGGS